MAEQFIEDIYRYSKTIASLEDVLTQSRLYQPDRIIRYFQGIQTNINAFCQDCINENSQVGNALYESFTKLTATKDAVLFGDTLENEVLPQMYDWVSSLASIDVEVNEKLSLVSSSSGFLTLCDRAKNSYFHSSINPLREAKEYVKSFYNSSFDNYLVFGCGLGYHIYELYQMSDCSIHITVFEHDPVIVDIAYKYGVLPWIPESDITVICDSDFDTFVKIASNSDIGKLYHVPSIENITGPNQKAIIYEMFVLDNSDRAGKESDTINFWRNVHRNIPDVNDLLKDHPIKENCYIIAGGPSLDENIDCLKERPGNTTLICVGTVFKKLLKANVRPDYVVISDPFPTSYSQIQEIENESVPIILDATAYWKIARDYQGPKYLINHALSTNFEIYQYSMNFPSHNWPIFSTVSGTAIYLSICGGSKNIYLFGLDLSFPNGKTHATGTALYKEIDTTGLIPIKSVTGETVYTNKLMNMYRHQIEQLIKHTGGVTFINMSSSGAMIAGCKAKPST